MAYFRPEHLSAFVSIIQHITKQTHMKKLFVLSLVAFTAATASVKAAEVIEDVSLRDIAESLADVASTQQALREARLQALNELISTSTIGDLFDLIDAYQADNSEALTAQIAALTELREKIDLWKEQNNINTPRLDAAREEIRGAIADAIAQYQAYREAYEQVGSFTENVGEILDDLRDYQPGDLRQAIEDYIQLLRDTFRPTVS